MQMNDNMPWEKGALISGKEDPNSLHGGCPVTKGHKWTATKWMRVGPYGAKREQEVKHRIAAAGGEV